MNIKEKLAAIQAELKAPKNQHNNFGDYNYRSCEDILEALKPLLAKHNCCLTIEDEVQLIGERYYIKATATLSYEDEQIKTSAFAREAATKRGMDESQITGASSSYARKYALNGLFCIDDCKDADTMDNRNPKEYKCAKCGKPFKAFTSKDGRKFSAAQVFHMAESKYGQAVCKDCANK